MNKPDADRINYIINKIFEAYNFKPEQRTYIFDINDIDHLDFEFDIKDKPTDYWTLQGEESLWGYYVRFLCNPIITKDLKEYKFFGKSRCFNLPHKYKFPTRWIFEDFEDELATGRILFKL